MTGKRCLYNLRNKSKLFSVVIQLNPEQSIIKIKITFLAALENNTSSVKYLSVTETLGTNNEYKALNTQPIAVKVQKQSRLQTHEQN